MARRLRLAAVCVAAVVALGGCGGEAGGAAGGTGGLSALVELKAADRKAAPAVSGETLDGAKFNVDSARGQVVVVNFWASWCPPCRIEAPELESVYRATKAAGVTFVGIDIRDDRDKAKAFQAAAKTSYPSIFDPAGRLALDFDVPPNTIPATLVIDRTGKLAVVIRAAVRKAELQPIIERLAAEGTDG